MLELVIETERSAPTAAQREVCVWRNTDGTPFARALATDALRWIEWPGLGVFAFGADTSIVSAWPEPGADPRAVADAFVRVLQPIILQARGYQALHASAVRAGHRVVAFCGLGRSGKSTLAFALRDRGFVQVADDALVLERRHGIVQAHPLPFAAGLREPSLRYFGDPATPTSVTRPSAGLTLSIVFELRQNDRVSDPVSIERIPPLQAFTTLLTHARCFDENDRPHTRQLVDDYLTIADSVPVYALTYPVVFGRLREVLDAVLERMAAHEVPPSRESLLTAVP